ncbi:MAG: hypothetical protein DME04_05955 [Candidatus Rokuibacteriota bacterium]|nr:MAG: hypothetical protein DME04_05955 [Candidatus Rokubacteria bacterium]
MFSGCLRAPPGTGLALLLAVITTTLSCPGSGVAQSTFPQLPLVFLDTTYVSPTGAALRVAAGGDFQAALDAVQPGDVIELQAGATFTGNFTLPYKTRPGWIYIQSSALSSLPSAGTRVAPAHATLMPKIVTPNASAALTTAAHAHHYRFIGVEITGTVTGTSSTQSNLVALGSGTDVVFDRCYIHGTPTGNYNQGIQLNNARTAVIDSYLADFHSTTQAAQAIVGWNGPGPFKLVNNHLEGSGENVMFGGTDPSVPNLVPSDIEIRRNHFFKPLAWRVDDPSYAGIPWRVHTLLALTNGRRVLIDGNRFENTWPDVQAGTAILFTVRNQDGTAPWSTVEDVTFTNNIVHHVGESLGMHGRDDLHPSRPSARFLIKNNLLLDTTRTSGPGWLAHADHGISDLVIDHNTGFMDQAVLHADGGEPHTRFIYTNNLTPAGAQGFAGTGTSQGIDTLTAYFPGAVFMRNVLAGGNASLYPAGNFFPAALAAVGFVDLTGGNYRLAASSPYKNAGTDGKDIGADIDAIEVAFAGGLVTAPTADSTAPTVVITSPAASATISRTVAVSATAADNVRVASVQFKLNGVNLAAVTAAPYTVSWNTTTALNGAHTLRAVARDAAGNETTSAPISVTVRNGDLTPPAVSITAPAAGTVAGTVTVSATATDNVGVVGVQFKLDGANLAPEVMAAPYAVSWNTTGAPNGPHTLTAVARDAAGNATTSTALSVTVSNAAGAGRALSTATSSAVTPLASAGATGCTTNPSANPGIPECPRIFLNTTYSLPTGGVKRTVNSGGDFQAALNAANSGDIIELQAGATFTGNFTLPSKSGPGWIYIQSSALAAMPEGTRVTPTQAALMPKIVTPNSSSAITSGGGSQLYRLAGLEITGTLTNTSSVQNNLVMFGGQSNHDFVLDRSYIHGQPYGNYKRGVELEAARVAIIDSWIDDIHVDADEAQGIISWNGAGPYKIVNNTVRAAAINILFGPSSSTVAADIEIRGNLMEKPWSWRVGDPSFAGQHWTIKNILELKNAQRVIIDGNILQNCWVDPNAAFGQQGANSLVLTARNQWGTCSWCPVEDVTITNNINQHLGRGIGIANLGGSAMQRILVRNNLWLDISSSINDGIVFMSYSDNDIIIDHNTAFQDGAAIWTSSGGPFAFTNNLQPVGGGIQGGWAPSTNTHNVEIGGPGNFPAGNFFPATVNDVGFVNYAGGDYRLLAGSPYKNAGTDGKDPGADIDTIDVATLCALTGACSGPPPVDTTAPTATITAPTSSATYTTSTTPLTLGGTASDNLAVTQVTWTNSRGGSGMATGTTSWTAGGIVLQSGSNVLTVTARDAAGNTGTATLTVTLTDTTAPSVTITAPTSNPTYTTGSSSLTLSGIASDNLGVTQVTWANDRGGSGTATGTTSWTASAIVLQSGGNVLTITARDAAGNTASNTLTATRTFTFTDDPPVAQSTVIKTVHIVELRAAIDSLRVAHGLTPFAWTDPTLTPVSSKAKAVHFSDLRTALNQAYQAAGRALPTYTDPTLTAGKTVVKAVHLTDLRTAARALQ